jgi:hypothetical protein
MSSRQHGWVVYLSLRALSTETAGECKVLGLTKQDRHQQRKQMTMRINIHCHPLGVDSSQVGVLEQGHKISCMRDEYDNIERQH